MDQIEHRINAHEMALIEVAAYIDENVLACAMRAIRAGIVGGISEDERIIRLQALTLLDDAFECADMKVIRLHWRGRLEPGVDAVRMLQERLGGSHPPASS